MTCHHNEEQDAIIGSVFRAAFENHPQRESDPGSALEDARSEASKLVPSGETGEFDDEELTYSTDVEYDYPGYFSPGNWDR